MDNLRHRKIKDERYLPTGLINAYLDDRMKPKEKKNFESLYGDMDSIKEIIQQKKQSSEFVDEFIPDPKVSAQNIRNLRTELQDINDTVLGEDKTSLGKKIVDILDTTIIEF